MARAKDAETIRALTRLLAQARINQGSAEKAGRTAECLGWGAAADDLAWLLRMYRQAREGEFPYPRSSSY